MKQLAYEIWTRLKFLQRGLWLPSPGIKCRLEWYTGTRLLEQLAASIIRIVTFFSAQLTLSGQPWKWRQKISPNLSTYTIIRMRCHILRGTHLRMAWWSHVRRHNNTRLYEVNKILPGLQPRWVCSIDLVTAKFQNTGHVVVTTTSRQAMESCEGRNKEKYTTSFVRKVLRLSL
jgi:hypothetical protein